jgi:hypothetical protein
MKFPRVNLRVESLTARLLVLLVCVAAAAVSISAQKARSLAPEAVSVDIEQCANGPQSAPIPCNVATGNEGYGRGNLVASKSHYFEGQFVPIRVIGGGLTAGTTYMVTLGYDYTKAGKYATDYLGSYNATESVNNNPCVGVTGCSLAVFDTEPVPVDPQVTAGFDGILGNTDDITQIPGVFTCFGCTITGVSSYSLNGLTTGDSSKSITVTLVANQENVVLAYGSHISSRRDWGFLNSAINISGSPYHNFIAGFPGSNSGNRDLQLSAEAVIFPAIIQIEKTVVNFFLQTSGGQPFGFTSSAALFPGTTFSLTDTIAEPYSEDVADRLGGTILSSDIVLFGSGNLITVSEDTPPTGWSLSDITCGSLGGTNNNTITLGTRSVSIQLEEGELVRCSFHNVQFAPSAAPASISGRAVDSFGNGIGGARITVMDAQSGTIYSAITSPFGYYTIEGTEVENFYTMTISHKRYTFADDTRTFTLHDNLTGMDFIANP